MDKDFFFAKVRSNPFSGNLTQPQVDGLNNILTGWNESALTDIRWLAYMLATTYWETGRTMQPIEEWGKGAGHSYGEMDPMTGQAYYGRGYVQLTWKNNYEKFATRLKIDLVNKPELALQPDVARDILFMGMVQGLFTGVYLSRYFSPTTDDPVNARRIINGTDRAYEIADIHRAFLAALQAPA